MAGLSVDVGWREKKCNRFNLKYIYKGATGRQVDTEKKQPDFVSFELIKKKIEITAIF